MLIYLDIKILHLQIAHLGGNLEVGNIKIHQSDSFEMKRTWRQHIGVHVLLIAKQSNENWQSVFNL